MSNNIYLKELKSLFHLALPIIINLLAYMAMQLVDVIMLGRVGALALAASALGNVVYILMFVGAVGILTSIGVLAAEAYGEQNHERVALIVKQGVWVVMMLAFIGIVLILSAPSFLLYIKEPPLVVAGAKQFLHGLVWGFLPGLGIICLREFVTAISKPKIITLIAIAAVPLNALLNYIFIYGIGGFPRLGIFGVGLATAIIDWLMLFSLLLVIATKSEFKSYKIVHFMRPDPKVLKILLRLGLPVGVSFMVEEILFVVAALMVGYFGVVALAAHQIAVQCLFSAVMIPIGIGQATAVRVSQSLGASKFAAAARSAYTAIVSGTLLALLVAILIWLFPNVFVDLFIDGRLVGNQPVVTLAIKMLMIMAFFHLIDALQLITSNALRGYQDTLVPMFLGLLSFWVLGIGSAYLFGFVLQFGALGIWWGLALGIIASAIILQSRLFYRVKLINKRVLLTKSP